MYYNKQCATYHGYFIDNDELDIWPYVELDLLIIVCLSIENPNKKCIIIPFINKVAFDVYATTLNFCCFHIFKK